MSEIDLIININLQMIYENESKEEYYTHFTDEKKGTLINHTYSGKTIAFEMVNKAEWRELLPYIIWRRSLFKRRMDEVFRVAKNRSR